MDDNKSLTVEFVKQTMLTFAAAVLAVSIVGWFVGDNAKGAVGMLRLGRDGLSYAAMLQIFIFSIAQAAIRVLILSNLLIKKMMLLWRTVIMLLSSFILTIALSVLFRWFPVGSVEAWLSFLISLFVCIAITMLLMIVKIKLEDKRIMVSLSDYKSKHRQGKDDEQ